MKKFGLSLIIGVMAFGLIVLLKLQPGKATASTVSLASTTPSTAGTPAPSTPAPSTPAPNSPATPAPAATSGGAFKNGTYSGAVVDNGYGSVQVAAVISNGKLSDVKILQVPNDRRSMMLASYSTPTLIQEAVSAQSANVDYVSGATATSDAFSQSLQDALSQAKS